MRAIVTGGAGFIGRRLVQRLVARNWHVLIVDDFSTHDWTNASKDKIFDSSRKGEGGISLANATAQSMSMRMIRHEKLDTDIIFHLAGKVGPIGVTKFKGLMAKDTLDAANAVAVWAYELGCPVIFTSTSEVYGNDATTNVETDNPVIQPASARSEYAVSKLAAEHMLLNRAGDIDIRVVRPFNIAGAGQRTDGGFVLPRFVKAALAKQKLTVYSPGTQKRSFTHIDDFVDGLALVYRDGKRGEIYNLGNPNNTSTIQDIALHVVQHVLPDYNPHNMVEIVDQFALNGPDFREAPDKIPNADKAMQKLGWQPRRTNCDIIQDVVEYWKSK